MKFVCSLTWIMTIIIGMNLSFQAFLNDSKVYCLLHLHIGINSSDVALIDMISHPTTKKQHLNETFRESW